MRGLTSENNDSSDDSLGSFNPNLEKWSKEEMAATEYDPAEFLIEYDCEEESAAAESDYASHDDDVDDEDNEVLN